MPSIVGYIFHQCLSLGFGVYRCGGDSHFSQPCCLLWRQLHCSREPGPGPGGGAVTGNAGTSCRHRTADTAAAAPGPSCPGRPDVPGRGINDQCSTN